MAGQTDATKSRSAGGADIFLSVKTKRAGAIKGESIAVDHTDEIDVDSWTWGVAASSALGSTQATSRRSYSHLVVCKQVDCASTSLMSVLATNDEVKEAKLTMRKAGGGQSAFFTIALSSARVVAIDMDCDAQGQVVERVSFAFNKVQVDYVAQQGSGNRGASNSFTDELMEAA
jgi:type VI secretion system secreted protein Hcp